jgi:hypothetical protein
MHALVTPSPDPPPRRNKARRLRRLLRRRPALATTQDSRGQTLLHQVTGSASCRVGSCTHTWDSLRFSAMRMALVDTALTLHATPHLHTAQACLCGHLEAAQVLLRYGADARVQDGAGNTPAHVAGLKGHLVLMSTLLQVCVRACVRACVCVCMRACLPAC